MNDVEKKKYRVVFICAGNTCRSPMAEAVLKTKIPKSLVNDIEVLSAGLNTFSGLSATVEAELACRLKGYRVADHRSQQASEILLENCDLILCMEPVQTSHIHEKYPNLASRTWTFRQFSSNVDEAVADPYTRDVSVYIKTLNRIIAEVNKCKTKIWDLARQKKKQNK